jgi:hypothetical protein
MINGEPFIARKDGHAVNHRCVGIVFMRGDDLWIDSTLVSHAGDYGELKTHEKGHADYWEELQAQHLVPADEEYDEVSRGRVSYDKRCRNRLQNGTPKSNHFTDDFTTYVNASLMGPYGALDQRPLLFEFKGT